jgi:hypothetical protein
MPDARIFHSRYISHFLVDYWEISYKNKFMASKSEIFSLEKPLRRALRAVGETRPLLIRELRDMAAADRADYRVFSNVPPLVRNLWSAAADELEAMDRAP